MNSLRQKHKLIISGLLFWVLAACSPWSGATMSMPLFGWHMSLAKAGSDWPVVAIIIDDIGYAYYAGKRCAEFPADLTLSIIPFTPHGRRLADAAYREGKEVMLHAPMETLNQGVWEPSLDRDMDQHEIIANLGAMIQSVPHIKGINNHGGSLFTQDVRRMGWLMTALEKAGLYFIDSRTTPQSVALAVAEEQGITAYSRDVFLDNDRSVESIEAQIQKLKAIAHRRGFALAIGHPHSTTLDALRRHIPHMEAEGIQVIPVSEYIKRAQREPLQ